MNIILTLPVLLYAGIFDAKKRIIPDKVHVFLLLIGLVEIIIIQPDQVMYIPMTQRLAGMLPAAILLLVYILDREASGGGDFKLLASLGFCVGFIYIIKILIVSSLIALIYAVCIKKKTIPLAAFIFIGALFSCLFK